MRKKNLKIQMLVENTAMLRFHVGFEIELPLVHSMIVSRVYYIHFSRRKKRAFVRRRRGLIEAADVEATIRTLASEAIDEESSIETTYIVLCNVSSHLCL